MDSHALRVLEYGELLDRLAECAQSQPGRSLARASSPSTDSATVGLELELTAEAAEAQEAGGLDLGSVQDTAPSLAVLAVAGAALEPRAILDLLGNQAAAARVRTTLRGLADRCPGLAALSEGLTPFREWEAEVVRSLDADGEVLDSASPALAQARREARGARASVVEKLGAFAGREGVAKVLQEEYITLRNGRFVLPARPEYHRAFEGVVQDSSSSGQTLFVEPLFAVELNNRLIAASAREQEEVRRVLARLSEGARGHREGMAGNLALLARLDLVFARARLGRRLGGVVPTLDEAVTELREVRHPLLALRPGDGCVPIDIEVGGEVAALVITGPNTGGKTVALKTLGLAVLMAQTGVPVPAASARVRVHRRIFADIGDEQSLAQNLSTFSAHLAVISGILAQADDRTLVLLDELGAGTDPQEGSALGVALLEALHRKGATVAATTHHNLLKEFAYRAPYARNASTIFDAASLRPTYRLRTGAPGRSHALEIASHLGVGQEVVSRAREVMGSGAVRADELLGRLSEELESASAARARAEEAQDLVEAELTRLREGRALAREEIRRERDEARREARTLVRDVEREGKRLLKELRAASAPSPSVLARGVEGLGRLVEERLPSPPPPRSAGGLLEVGQQVDVLSLGVAGRVVWLSEDGQRAEVEVGGVRLRVGRDRLEGRTGPAEEGQGRGPAAVTYDGQAEAPHEINLLGCTVEEALRSVDTVLDRSLLGSGRRLRIVHGKGTGALRQAIARALRDDPRVAAFATAPLEEGGAGVTIVELKE